MVRSQNLETHLTKTSFSCASCYKQFSLPSDTLSAGWRSLDGVLAIIYDCSAAAPLCVIGGSAH
jgi:hypothetical protein